jgi:pilus assembly protein Flp/PilA
MLPASPAAHRKNFAAFIQTGDWSFAGWRHHWQRLAKNLAERRIIRMKKFFMNEEGQGMVEYGLIIALVAVVVIAAIALLGNGVKNTFGNITNTLK